MICDTILERSGIDRFYCTGLIWEIRTPPQRVMGDPVPVDPLGERSPEPRFWASERKEQYSAPTIVLDHALAG